MFILCGGWEKIIDKMLWYIYERFLYIIVI